MVLVKRNTILPLLLASDIKHEHGESFLMINIFFISLFPENMLPCTQISQAEER